MTAQLNGHLIVWAAAMPDRNRRLHRLEIDVRNRIAERFHRFEQGVALHYRVTLAQRPALTRGDRTQLHIVGKITDSRPTRRLEFGQHLLGDFIKRADVISGRLRPAAIDERTRIGALAMRANCNGGGDRQSRGDHLQPHLFGDLDETGFHLLGDVDAREEIGEIGIHALAIQVHDLAAHDRYAGGAQHVCLDGHVGNVFELADRCLGFHLDKDEATLDALEDVREDERIVGDDCRLVNRRHRFVGDGVSALFEDRVEAAAAALDQFAARHVSAGDEAYSGALLHPEPGGESRSGFRR